MRLWSLHPRHLDPKGLVALWREGLLAQAVLRGKTRGYTRHPQLRRFRDSREPRGLIASYLAAVEREAARRGYSFDARKIGRATSGRLPVTSGQLAYEWKHLRRKLKKRAPAVLRALPRTPAAHPLFKVIRGGVADWEVR